MSFQSTSRSMLGFRFRPGGFVYETCRRGTVGEAADDHYQEGGQDLRETELLVRTRKMIRQVGDRQLSL